MSMTQVDGAGRLADRVTLITGGAQGIGRAIAALFQAQGACAFLLDCDHATGARTAAELTAINPSRPVRYIATDLRQPAEIQNAVRSLRRFHDRVDVLVNNAGVELDRPTETVTAEDWDLVLNVNLRGAFLLTKELLPLFSGSGGSIVNISSIHASHAFPNSVPYACSKAAMVALTRNLALDLANRHIRVNCICPGYIDTRLWEHYLQTSDKPDEIAYQTAALHPIGRRGVPHDVAEAALFLASDSSAFITGTDLVVDGGLTVRAHP
jgi:NAD(P)-dependent dehydrogenase (short-subunit alcohol dehydrogenase family)